MKYAKDKNEVIRFRVSLDYKIDLLLFCRRHNIKNISTLIRTALDEFIKNKEGDKNG